MFHVYLSEIVVRLKVQKANERFFSFPISYVNMLIFTRSQELYTFHNANN
jgi:hypothetical protein